MNSNERARELLALRLYGELDAAEKAELEGYLSTSAEVRQFAVELEAGLGAVAAALPPTPQVGRRSIPWRASLVSFAAGLLLSVLWPFDESPSQHVSDGIAGLAGRASGFERAAPPPPAAPSQGLARVERRLR